VGYSLSDIELSLEDVFVIETSSRVSCTTAIIMSGLPQELIDHIIDHVNDRNWSVGNGLLVAGSTYSQKWISLP